MPKVLPELPQSPTSVAHSVLRVPIHLRERAARLLMKENGIVPEPLGSTKLSRYSPFALAVKYCLLTIGPCENEHAHESRGTPVIGNVSHFLENGRAPFLV